jgi:hypothetical protein
MNKIIKQLLKYCNIYLLQLITWTSIIVLDSKSNACPKWKVLYLLIALLGFNQSYHWWSSIDKKTEHKTK